MMNSIISRLKNQLEKKPLRKVEQEAGNTPKGGRLLEAQLTVGVRIHVT